MSSCHPPPSSPPFSTPTPSSSANFSLRVLLLRISRLIALLLVALFRILLLLRVLGVLFTAHTAPPHIPAHSPAPRSPVPHIAAPPCTRRTRPLPGLLGREPPPPFSCRESSRTPAPLHLRPYSPSCPGGCLRLQQLQSLPPLPSGRSPSP